MSDGPFVGTSAGLQTAPRFAARTKAKALADAPSSLRGEVIAAAQRDAGEAYAVREEAGELRAKARGFSVRYDTDGAHIGAEGNEHGALTLARAGCEGALGLVSPVEPSFAANRVAFARQADGVRAEEWYLTGPMGLEQGFTVQERPACAVTGGDLVLEIATEGLVVVADGEALKLEAASGERYRYSDPFAKDATGRALPVRMERTAEGRIALEVEVAGAVFPVNVDPLLASQEAKLLASDGVAGNHFGYSVALSGDTALVGAPTDDYKGSAYIFVRSGTSWAEQAKLLASDGAVGDYFGYSVALSGDTALVGAWGHNGSAYDFGSAYVFVRSGTSWTEQAQLLASDGAAYASLGFAVALNGDTALLGAPSKVGGTTSPGSAYVFARSGTSWTEQAKLLASDGVAGDQFGSSVALSGDTALVGADPAGNKVGSAYAFARSGTSWSQQAKLVASDGAAGNHFGGSVALSGDTTIVGASGDANNKGSAYVFVQSGTSWSEQSKLLASGGVAADFFGFSVGLTGDTALVGALGVLSKGSAYAFVRSGTSWTEQAKILPSDAAVGFGRSAALSPGMALVGADNDGTSNPGAAYVFALTKGKGDPCGIALECDSGFCADGICCDTACVGGTCAGGTCQPSGSGGGAGTSSGGNAGTSSGGSGGASIGGSAGVTTGGSSAGGAGGGGGSGTGGSPSSGSNDDSGCGCRTTASERSNHAAWLLLALGLAAARRRRAAA